MVGKICSSLCKVLCFFHFIFLVKTAKEMRVFYGFLDNEGIGLILVIQTFYPSTLSVLYNKDILIVAM